MSTEFSFLEFLQREGEELRRRLLWTLGALILVFGGLIGLPSWEASYSLKLAQVFQQSLLPPGTKLVFLDPLEPMVAVAKLTLAMSLAACSPLFIWHSLAFTAPAFEKGMRAFYVRFTLLAIGLFSLGLFLGWRFLLPMTLEMLLSYGQSAGAVAQLTFDKFYGFTAMVLLAFALPFETPLVMAFLQRFNIVEGAQFRQWRFKAWGIFILVSQFVTPDPLVTPALFSGLCILLYELGIRLSRFV